MWRKREQPGSSGSSVESHPEAEPEVAESEPDDRVGGTDQRSRDRSSTEERVLDAAAVARELSEASEEIVELTGMLESSRREQAVEIAALREQVNRAAADADAKVEAERRKRARGRPG
jgi:hypothetical protein